MIGKEEILFKPFIYIYYNEYAKLTLIAGSEYYVVGNVGKLTLPIAYYGKLHKEYPKILKNEENCYIDFEIPYEIMESYNNEQYSQIYSLTLLIQWKKYLIKHSLMRARDSILFQILTCQENLKDRVERDLGIPRGFLDGKELFFITNYYLHKNKLLHDKINY